MARTESAMIQLGTQAPHFSLTDVREGGTYSTGSLTGSRGLLVMFICAHCPFVKHIERELARLGEDYLDSGIGIAAISSNDAEKYPDDAPSALAEQALALGFTFPYLYDETQDVARAFDAACTPDFFSLTAPESSPIAASSTPAAPAAISRLPERICARLSMR